MRYGDLLARNQYSSALARQELLGDSSARLARAIARQEQARSSAASALSTAATPSAGSPNIPLVGSGNSVADVVQLAASNFNINPGIIRAAGSLATMLPKLAEENPPYQVKVAFVESEELLEEYEDSFGKAWVVLRDGIHKDLIFNKKNSGVQTRISIEDPRTPQLEYIKSMCLMSALHPDPRNVLFLGTGGGSLPKYWIDNFPEVKKTAVDIRPMVFEIAQEHFDFRPDVNTQLVEADANAFLVRAKDKGLKYDIIYVDIYIQGPADIQNNEYFWKEISECLAPGGIVCTNLWTSGENEIKAHNIKGFHRKLFNTTFKVTNSESPQIALCGTDMDFSEVNSVQTGIRAIEQTAPTNINFTEIMSSHLKEA